MTFPRRLAAPALGAIILLAPLGAQPALTQQSSSFEALMAADRPAEAERLARTELADLDARGLGDTPDAAASIERILRTLILQAIVNSDALTLAGRGIRIREALRDDEGLERALLDQVRVLELESQESQELPYAQRAVDLATRLWPAGDRRLLDAQHWLGMALYRASRDREAAALLREVIAGQERVVPDSLELARSFHTLALVAGTLRDYAESISLAERGLRIREREGDLRRAANSANLLGGQLAEIGDYQRAREFMELSINYRARTIGVENRLVGMTVSQMAELYQQMDDTDSAAASYQRALKLLDGDWRSGVVAARYAYLLTEQGDLEGARTQFERSMADSKRRPMPPVANAVQRSYYGAWLWKVGRKDEARREAEAALDIRERYKLPLGLGASLGQVAAMAADAGDFDKARQLYERALEVHDRMMRNHPDTRNSRYEYAAVLARMGAFTEAQKEALTATDTTLYLERLALRGLPERQAVGFADTHRRTLELALSLADKQPPAGYVAALFDRVVRSRALVLDEMSQRQRTGGHGADGAHVALALAREQLARLAVRGPDAMGAKVFEETTARLRSEAERAEEAVAAASQRRLSKDEDHIGFAEVIKAIPAGTALVAYVQYDDVLPGDRRQPSSSRYAAFVVSPDRPDPVFVPLGAAAPIDAATTATRAELQREATAGGRGGRRTLASYRAAGARLRRLVWDPIGGHVAKATRVLIVPDGALHLVSFAALPSGTDRYLVDTAPTLHRLAAERDVLRQRDRTTWGHGLLAVGRPGFDAASTVASVEPGEARQSGATKRPTRAACGSLAAMRFGSLPATGSEAAAVARLWNESRSGEVAELLTDASATETAVKARAPGHRLLHLATHGFFSAGACPDSGGARETTANAAAPVAFDNAMLRAGLAMAGVNHRSAAGVSEDDGMLLATEVASLDLSGVEWAVLSACDTGLGSIAAGEGVFGLQRAFRVAGAATVIMTLWPVDDHGTQAWIERLYRARLIGGNDTAESVRRATRDVLDARRAGGQSTHPFYWGGFVAAGDWR